MVNEAVTNRIRFLFRANALQSQNLKRRLLVYAVG